MNLNIKSLFLTVMIVGGFIYFCFQADQIPGISSYIGGEPYGPQSTLEPKGPIAQSHLDSFMLSLWVAALLCITVGGPLVYAMFAFKEKPGFDPKKDQFPRQTHGNTIVVLGLIGYSMVLLILIAFLPFGKMKIPALAAIPYFFEGKTNLAGVPSLESEEDPLEINVTGHQWWFSFHYPEFGIVTSNEFVFPTHKAVKINLETEDVMHSFWLAKIAGQVDLIPGQTNHMWLYTEEEGNYSGQCAEFCGDSHAYMLFRGIATSQDKFEQWIKSQTRMPKIENKDDGTYLSFNGDPPRKLTALEALGEKLYNGKAIPAKLKEMGHKTNGVSCNRCHIFGAMPHPKWPNPNLNHLAERNTIAAGWRNLNAEQLKTWIQQPGKVKPGNRMWRDFATVYKVIDANTTETLFNRNQTRENAHYRFFTTEEANALAAFLLTLKDPQAPDWGEPPLTEKKKSDYRKTAQLRLDQESSTHKLARN